MNRAKNDATLKKLGDIYQYYIALLECFKMNENERIQIEVCGDVSKISKNASFQMEVKHHIGNDLLGERDIDIWKTLKNWVIEYNRISDFSQLILFTTSEITENSLFMNWNDKNSSEKLKTIKAIGSVVKHREKDFRKLYNEIFSENYDEGILVNVLSKFEILTKQVQIARIDKDFSLHIKHIPEVNREKFIAVLLGIIVDKVKNEPHFWEITYKDFEQILQETSSLFMKPDVAPLPIEYADLIPSVEIETAHQDKEFVKAIKKIQYDKQIPRAIKDYWRTNMTIIKYYRNNLGFNKNLSNYRDNLGKKLQNTKETLRIDHEGSDRLVQIKESKKLYSSTMAWDATPFQSVNPNQPFFQKGMIHEIVESGDFSWDVGDENEY
ncbi:MAG: hypothetical protein KAX49_03645 [Halanaerobiales bacterium]|nr:hypothetical protein [Halanaerobiales bacterium]